MAWTQPCMSGALLCRCGQPATQLVCTSLTHRTQPACQRCLAAVLALVAQAEQRSERS